MKSELVRKLSKVEDFENPKVSLEQYITPPELAADLLHVAYLKDDLEGKNVADLGTGTGRLAIGSALSGAEVKAVEKDKKAIEQARKNAESLGVEGLIDFLERDVQDFNQKVDTVVMNPPFSVHSETGINFIKKAIEVSGAVYTVSHPGSRKAIKEFVKNSKHNLEAVEGYKIALSNTYDFHTENFRDTGVDVIVTRRNKDGT